MCLQIVIKYVNVNTFTHTQRETHACKGLCFGRAFNRTQMRKQGSHRTARVQTMSQPTNCQLCRCTYVCTYIIHRQAYKCRSIACRPIHKALTFITVMCDRLFFFICILFNMPLSALQHVTEGAVGKAIKFPFCRWHEVINIYYFEKSVDYLQIFLFIETYTY